MTDAVDAFLAGYPPAMRAITHELRALVLGAAPAAQEVLYASQNHFGYSLTGKRRDLIIYICPMKDYVRLGFFYGDQLPDPAHLLEGEGKRLRHVKVRTLDAARLPALADLVRAAWADAPRPAAKRDA